MRCLVCGCECKGDHAAYCDKCRQKRLRNPPEIDPETGEWIDGEPRETV